MVELKLSNGTKVDADPIEMSGFEKLDLAVIPDPTFPLMVSVMEIYSGLIVSPSSSMTKKDAISQTRDEFLKRNKTQSSILNGLKRLKQVNPSSKMDMYLQHEKEHFETLDYVHSEDERAEFRKMIKLFEEASIDPSHLVTNMNRKQGNKTSISDLWNNVVLPTLNEKRNPKREEPVDELWIDSILGNSGRRDYSNYIDGKLKDSVITKINKGRSLFKLGKITHAELISVNDLIFPMMRIATQEKARQLSYRNYKPAKLQSEYERLNFMLDKADEIIKRFII
ncbi:MAG TPA: hypothetical protein VGQ59_14995 [Cyclobacteriaceae bacterium]|jgi:hypothetical protein|nr:hypothetical protein [Cyclobacteriaceae bacterium]